MVVGIREEAQGHFGHFENYKWNTNIQLVVK